MDWKFDDKGKRVQKEVGTPTTSVSTPATSGKGNEDEEEPKKYAVPVTSKKEGKKKKTPEPAEKPRIEWSCKEDAIGGFKQVCSWKHLPVSCNHILFYFSSFFSCLMTLI
jgi:hypothetical protein